MADKIETIHGSVIQHGKDNDRIYLMKLEHDAVQDTVHSLDGIAEDNGYTKIIAKVPDWAVPQFEKNGYALEAIVPRLYRGCFDVHFMGKYFSDIRSVEQNADAIFDVLSIANRKAADRHTPELPEGFTYSVADESLVREIGDLYREVFKSYPFPILDDDYIAKTMKENVIYFCVHSGSRIVAVASSEMDVENDNVEMTDFATLPEYQSQGLAVFLLQKMEEVMRLRGMITAYTIARALSYGMNITFAKMGYEYGGTLANNTDICGNMESMNIWYKPLAPVRLPESDLCAAQR